MTHAMRGARFSELWTHRRNNSENGTTRSAKRGYSLIELVAVLAVTSLIAVVATSLLVSILQQNSVLGAQLRIDNSQRQLANRFRRDVHAAESFELGEATIALHGPETLVTYSYETGFIRRTTMVNDEQRQHHFDVDNQHAVEFHAIKLEGRDLIQLTIRMDETKMDVAGRFPVANAGMRTVAELGRNYRWVPKEETP